MVYWPDHWLIVWCLTYCRRYLWQHCCLNCAWYLTFWSNTYAAHVFYSQVYFCRSVLWDKALGICTLSANLATHPTLPVDHINPLPTFSIFTIYCIHRYIYYSHFNQYTHCIHYTHYSWDSLRMGVKKCSQCHSSIILYTETAKFCQAFHLIRFSNWIVSWLSVLSFVNH